MPVPDEQVIELLFEKIRLQTAYLKDYNERYTGRRILQMVADEYREVYGVAVDGTPRLMPPRTGMAAIGVDALVDRMVVEGFDAAPAPSGAPTTGDRLLAAAQSMWDDNDLDAMHGVAQREALIGARSFALVWPGVDGRAVISIESADQVAVHRQTAPPYDVDASLKVSIEEWTGQTLAFLWRDGFRSQWRLSSVPRTYMRADGVIAATNWEPLSAPVRSPFGQINPMVEFAHWTRLRDEPMSSIEPVGSLVDEADLCEALKVFAGHFGAVPIRWAVGLPVPRDPADATGQTPLLGPDGRPVIGFNPRADHLWTSTSEKTEFGQFTPATLEGFMKWSDDTANKIRAKTAVPEFYYGASVVSHTNAEMLKTSEAPMTRRVLSVRGSFGQGFRRTTMLGLSLDVPGVDPRARLVVPRYANPETRVETQATDAFQKQVAAGVPLQVAMRETLGWRPEVVQEAMRARDADRQAAELAAARAAADSGAGGDTVPARLAAAG